LPNRVKIGYLGRPPIKAVTMYKVIVYLMAFSSFFWAKSQPANSFIERKITFSGYTWTVRNTLNTQGPGPNYFKTENVSVDQDGYLHLVIRKDPVSGDWSSAEITADNLSGYGTYQFVVDGPLDKLDKNIVLGLFNYSGKDGLDEMDIEFARWGNDKYPNLNYTIWPAQTSFKNASAVKEFTLQSTLSTHYFRRSPDSVVCASFNGTNPDPNQLIYSYVFTGTSVSISKLPMPVHINLWLFDGHPPTDQKPVEIVIRSFIYKP
jgi:hypothetical protein